MLSSICSYGLGGPSSTCEELLRRFFVTEQPCQINPVAASPVAVGSDTTSGLAASTALRSIRFDPFICGFRANKLHALRIRGLGATSEPTLKGTADYRRFVDSNPPWAVEEALRLAEVLRGDD